MRALAWFLCVALTLGGLCGAVAIAERFRPWEFLVLVLLGIANLVWLFTRGQRRALHR